MNEWLMDLVKVLPINMNPFSFIWFDFFLRSFVFILLMMPFTWTEN